MQNTTGVLFSITFRTYGEEHYNVEYFNDEYSYIVGGIGVLNYHRTFRGLQEAKEWTKSSSNQLMKKIQEECPHFNFSEKHYKQFRNFIDECFSTVGVGEHDGHW